MYNDLIGIPFVRGGRTAKGLDCYGLAMEVFRRNGVEIPEYDVDYTDEVKINKAINDGAVSERWKKIETPTVPCLLTIRFAQGFVNHVGVYIGNGRFIHTRERVGVCIERTNSPAWRGLIEGYYEYNNCSKEPV